MLSPPEIKTAARIKKHCGLTTSLAWLINRKVGWPRTMSIWLSGRPIIIRPLSPDADVAITSLTDEFKELFELLPNPSSQFIIDAGGYIGTAAIALSEAYPNATIISLEPSSENFSILCRNVKDNKNIVPINKAIAPSAGAVTLRNRGTGQWGYTIIQSPADSGETSPIEEINCTTVDGIMKEFGYSEIGVLKLDIEGAELELLQGNIEWIGRTDAICIELHDRIAPGCTERYEAAVSGRLNTVTRGEKRISISSDAAEKRS